MKNRIIKDSFFILLANALTYVTSIVTTKIISVTFPLAEYGFRSQIMTIATLLSSICSLGLSSAATYFIPLSNDRTEKNIAFILRNIYVILIPICLFVLLVSCVGGDGIAVFFKNPELAKYRVYFALISAEHIIFSIYAGSQIAQHRALRSTLTNCCRAVTVVVVTWIICYLHKDIFTVIIGSICIDVVFCIYTVIDATKVFKFREKWLDSGLIKEILKYCIPLGLSSITGVLCSQIDKVFVSKLLTLEDLAIYTNMCTELPLAAISGAFIAVITPFVVKMISQNKVEAAVEMWGQIVELVAIILFPIITVLVVFSRQVIIILYSEDYVVGYQLFRIFAIMELSRLTYYGLILKSYGKSSLILLCSGLTLILDVLLNLLFYFGFGLGMYGLALGTLSSTFIVLILQLIMSSKVSGVKMRQIFPWRALLLCAVVNIALGCGAWLVSYALGFNHILVLWKFVLLGIIWAIIYLLLMARRIKNLYQKTMKLQN